MGNPKLQVNADGDKYWYLNGERHRTDGPAIERANADNFWYLNGRFYTLDDWLTANNELSDESKVMLKLKYG